LAPVDSQRRPRKRRWSSSLPYLVLGAILAFVAVASWTALNNAQAGASAPAKGSGRVYPAPDFRLTLFDGSELALSDLRGKAVVLNFWASWCPPCREEARDMERVWQAYRDRGVVFLGVNIQDSEQNARAFMEEFGISYPNGQDTGDIASSYGLTGIPETFFITGDGTVNRRWIGAIGERQLATFIEALLE
jgi:cytochrome c biogenesis protein CcmG, thiol:disulfide interchange protein DsbE